MTTETAEVSPKAEANGKSNANATAPTEPVTVTTASGFMFTLRPPHLVPERLRRPLANKLLLAAEAVDAESDGTSTGEALADNKITGDRLALMDSLNDLLAVALVVAWRRGDVDLPIPVTLDAVLDLPAGDYDALRLAVAPYVHFMLPDFSPTPAAGTPTKP